MSDGSSLTQISECGTDQVVTVDSITSIDSTSDINSDDTSDCTAHSDSDSDSCASEPSTSVDIERVERVERDDDEEQVEQRQEKSPVGERIAKDTGCCLYSGISALVVMVVLLGIVLIVTGPALGLSFPPLIRASTPIATPIEHNHLLANQTEFASSYGSYDSYNSHDNYHQPFHLGYQSSSANDSFHNSDHAAVDSVEYDVIDDYHEEADTIDLSPSTDLNATSTTAANGTAEDLSSLTPEALRLNPKYVAYVPIPLHDDDVDGNGSDNYDESGNDSRQVEEYDDSYVDEAATPRSSSSRRRPEGGVDKVILPILMIPTASGGSSDSRMKDKEDSDAWGSSEYSSDSYPPRRFDEDISPSDEHYEDHLTPSSSRRIPGFRNGGNRRRGPGGGWRKYGNRGPDVPPHLRRQGSNRPRFRHRGRPRPDDFARTTSLYPERVFPQRTRNNKGKLVEGRDGPAFYIRPPPRPRPRPISPARNQFTAQNGHPSHVWSAGQVDRQRTLHQQTTRKPGYSYPKDAMSIQDIISYMTSLSHSDETTERARGPSQQQTPENRIIWSSNQRQPISPSRSRNDPATPWPNVLPPPSSMGITADSRQLDSTLPRPSSGANPYSFKLDVYPIREDGGSQSSSFRQYTSSSGLRYPPSSSVTSYRQLQDANYYVRQPATSGDSTGGLADIDYSYKIRYPEEQTRYADVYKYRRPSSSYYDQNYRDDMPVPLAFRPTSSSTREESTTAKPKVVVHLNVFNQHRGASANYRAGYGEDRHDEEDEDDYYSPSDIYRAVLKNNAGKRDHESEGGEERDDAMLGGQSRVGSYSNRRTSSSSSGGVLNSASSSSSHHQENPYENHNMAVSSTDHYYQRAVRRPLPPSNGYGSSTRSGASSSSDLDNYRLSHQSRNYYPVDDSPEPLPIPMALNPAQDSVECGSPPSADCKTLSGAAKARQQTSETSTTTTDTTHTTTEDLKLHSR